MSTFGTAHEDFSNVLMRFLRSFEPLHIDRGPVPWNCPYFDMGRLDAL